MKTSDNYLVIGASGKTGHRVLRSLLARGYNAYGASRYSDVTFDWHDQTTWASALKNADKIYVTYYPDLAMPNAPEDISRFCTLAKIKGVQHITLLSGRGEPMARRCEKILAQSGVDWTVVRASWFNQNFSEGLFAQFIQEGELALPVDETPEPFIDIDDIADVVVDSLTKDKHKNKLYEVTGPECLSFRQLAEKFSQQLGREVSFTAVSLDDFTAQMKARGTEDGAIGALIYLFTEVLDGRNAHVAYGVESALGRPAKSFGDYINDNAALFNA